MSEPTKAEWENNFDKAATPKEKMDVIMGQIADESLKTKLAETYKTAIEMTATKAMELNQANIPALAVTKDAFEVIQKDMSDAKANHETIKKSLGVLDAKMNDEFKKGNEEFKRHAEALDILKKAVDELGRTRLPQNSQGDASGQPTPVPVTKNIWAGTAFDFVKK
jgi:hypothetical protein